jgi:hypothetical protein
MNVAVAEPAEEDLEDDVLGARLAPLDDRRFERSVGGEGGVGRRGSSWPPIYRMVATSSQRA